MKAKIIEDGTELLKAIKSIQTRGRTLDVDIQQAAMSAIWHFGARKNVNGDLIGDTGFINRLYLALGKGARHAALTEWFTQFGGVSANTDERTKEQNPFVKDKNKQVDLEGGDSLPWYECKKSPAPDMVVDYLALFMKVATKKAKSDQTVKNAAVLARVQKILKEYEEEQQAVASHTAIADTADTTTND